MASYALPTTVSPPDFDRRSFFLSNSRGHTIQEASPNLHRKFFNKVQSASQRSFYTTTPIDDGILREPKDFMPTRNRPRGESDLGKPALRPRPVSTAYNSPRPSSGSENTLDTVSEAVTPRSLPIELFTAIIIPMPFLLSSLIHTSGLDVGHTLHATKTDTTEEMLHDATLSPLSRQSRSSSVVQACVLASGTLVMVGIIGRIAASANLPPNRKSQARQEKSVRHFEDGQFSLKKLRHLSLRAVSVTLPFLATAEIGGLRTGVFLLATTAAGALAPDIQMVDQKSTEPWKKALMKQKWTLLVFILCLLCDLFVFRKDLEPSSTLRGYGLLAKSMLFLQLPNCLASSSTQQSRSPLIGSRAQANCTLTAGAFLSVFTLALGVILSATPTLTLSSLAVSLTSIAAAAGLLVWSRPSSLRSREKSGLIFGILCCVAFHVYFDFTTINHLIPLSVLLFLLYAAVQLDSGAPTWYKSSSVTSIVRCDSTHHHHKSSDISLVTDLLLRYTEEFPLIHSILLDKQSRRIVYFMSINLGFMFVQAFYALVAGSLGLLSDSIHMLFDCVGLLAGLIASVMSKWPPNAQFPYGYGKVETLSGLGNGIFLIIISVEIIWESFERFMEGAELRRLSELLVVSIGGLAVNCIGLIFIGHHHHGHSHSHAHSHGHVYGEEHIHTKSGHRYQHVDGHEDADDYQNDALSLALTKTGLEVEKPTDGGQVSAHHHQHAGNGRANENMAGIYLHILADTMGSVAVIASTLLTKYTGWSGWDPIASCIIAVLIILASYPLVVGSARQLLLTLPGDVEFTLRSTLQEISGLRGVSAYAVPRFWLDDTDGQPLGQSHHAHDRGRDQDHHPQENSMDHEHYHHDRQGHDHNENEMHECSHNSKGSQRIVGVIHVIATHNADLEEVRVRVGEFFQDRNMDALVHVEREEQSHCWCGGAVGGGGHARNRSTVAM